MTQPDDASAPPWRPYLAVWALLVALLGLSLGVAYLPLGRRGTVAGIAVAIVKAALVVVVYMGLGRSSALVRLAAGAGCLFAIVLFALTFSDVLSRP